MADVPWLELIDLAKFGLGLVAGGGAVNWQNKRNRKAIDQGWERLLDLKLKPVQSALKVERARIDGLEAKAYKVSRKRVVDDDE